MLRIALNRAMSAGVLIVLASIFSFGIVAAFPGNVAVAIAELRGGVVSREVIEQIALEYHLNDPLIFRYWYWLSDVMRGDLGVSLRTGEHVASALAERLSVTAVLVAGGGIVSLLVSFLLAFSGAMWPGKAVDKFVHGVAILNMSIPKFFLAITLIYIFGVTYNVLPTFGFQGPLSWILPCISIGLLPGALLSRVARVSIEETMSRPFVITAASKGFGRRRILLYDALPNVLPVLLTAFGMHLAFTVQSSVIVEPIFAWQGFGTFFVEAARFRDLPVLQACLLFMSVLFILANLIVDLCVMLVDPRQRRAASTRG